MIRLADYVFRTLADRGLRQVFLLTGGGAMHLNDAVGRERRLRYTCMHHEQACAMAAESYARIAGKPAILNVTTGPGGINALNGVFGAWTDSIPMIVISGQVKRETCLATYGQSLAGLRQLGDQEVDIIRMAKGITKYAEIVLEPSTIRYHLERALYLATHGRPGPVWLDIPVDVQSAQIDETALPGHDEDEDRLDWDAGQVAADCRQVLSRIERAERPVILAGTGIRAGDAVEEFRDVIEALGIPVTTAWTHDIIATDHPLFCGRPGTIGQRAGNFTAQNADLLLVLGSRLNIRQVSYNWTSFARAAFKIQVDVDGAELSKPTVRPDLPIHCDLKVFLAEMRRQLAASPREIARHAAWLKWCRERVCRYPSVLSRQRRLSGRVNPYHFIEALFEELAGDDVVVCGNAAACITPFQAGRLREEQRLISNSGAASMGYDLPAAIGAAVARDGRRVVCLAGDGSIQLNIQELQTVVHHGFPLKIFVLNNDGYLSIRQTQSNFFGRLIGEGATSGVSFPDMVKIGCAYGLGVERIGSAADFNRLKTILETPGPLLCDVVLDPAQEFEPRMKSRQLPDGKMVSPNLEDMYPFLDPGELRSNLVIGKEA